ncbi:MAG: hypothetical protein ACE5KM_24950, partial [Planctomycetaceae bacterium]
LLPLLKDPRARPPRTFLVMRSTQAFALRSGSWKLALCPGSGSAGRYGNTPPSRKAWKQAVKTFGRNPRSAEFERAPFVQLFDLDADVGETTNLAAKRPDRVREMIRRFRTQIANGRSTKGPKQSNDVDRVPVVRNSVPR